MTPCDYALLMVYASVKHRLKVGVAEYIEALKDWDIVPLTENGRVIGGVLQKENEVHIGYGVKPKTSIRRHLRATLDPVIEKYGYAITKVQTENISGLRFCKRLGFVTLTEQNGTILLRCDRSNYA